MLALGWEMETICAAMREAFCIWQGTPGWNQQRETVRKSSSSLHSWCALIVSIPVLGGCLKLFLVYRLGDREKKKNNKGRSTALHTAKLLTTSIPGSRSMYVSVNNSRWCE